MITSRLMMAGVAAVTGTLTAESLPQKITEVQEAYPTATVIRVTAEEGFSAGRDKVRAFRAAYGGRLPAGGVFVEFADGTYRLSEPVVFTSEDTGTPHGGNYGIRDGFASVNDRYGYRQTLTLKKGRRVTISYRASCL